MNKKDKKEPLENKHITTKYIEESMNPVLLIILVPGVIFFAEIVVMVLLSLLPPLSVVNEALIDASLLILFLIPMFYFLLLKPFQLHLNRYWRGPKEKKKIFSELKDAQDEVKTLRLMLPICTNCKNIRSDKEYLNQVENYVMEHSESEFTNVLCLECSKVRN